MRFANHAGEKANTIPRLMPYNNRWHVFYVAVRDINVGEAITSDYGPHYFQDRPVVQLD